MALACSTVSLKIGLWSFKVSVKFINLKFQQIALTNQGQYSGLNDYDYQDLANLTEGRIKDLQQIKTVNKVPIPNEIMEHFKSKLSL